MSLALKLVALSCLVSITLAADVETTWNMSIRDRMAGDPFQTGFSKVWTVNDVYPADPGFTTPAGTTITINIPIASAANYLIYHEFAIFTDPNSGGSSTGAVVTLTPDRTTAVTTTWTPQAAGVYWWGCTVSGHTHMGQKITVTGGSGGGTSAGSSTGPSGGGASTSSGGGSSSTSTGGGSTPAGRGSTSICDYYSSGMPGSNAAQRQYALVSAIVTRAVTGGSGNGQTVTGIINLEEMKPFFNSSINYRYAGSPNGAAAAPNFYTNVNEFNALASKLVGFFGVALGCTAQGTNATEFPAYSGSTDMTAIHKNMPITNTIFTLFNGQIAKTAISFGVASADVDTVGGLLSSFNRGAFNSDGTPVQASYATNIICNDEASCPCADDTHDPANGCKPLPGQAASNLQAITLAAVAAIVVGMIAARQ